jgi:hypothetical protein
MTNAQTPMANEGPMPKHQLVIGHWSFTGHWGLVIGACRFVRYVIVGLAVCTLLAACVDKKQPTSQPTSARERQEQALRDPYSVGRDDEERYDISGGETREFDRKAFKRDWDSFWNP